VDRKFEEALTFIEAHRGLYVEMTLRRVVYLWTGFWSFSRRYLQEEPLDPPNIVFCTSLTVLTLLGLYRTFRVSGDTAMPYALVFFFFPMIYYLTHPEDYYRRPIDPLFAVLAAYAINSWMRNRPSPIT